MNLLGEVFCMGIQQRIIELTGNKFAPLNLSEHFNNDGISFDDLKCDGSFDGPGSTYPAEELPESRSVVVIDNIPFFFPSKERGDKNNILLKNQVITFEENHYEELFILGAADGQRGEIFEEEFILSFSDKTSDSVYVGLSNWLLQPAFEEKIAFVCTHLHWPDEGQEVNRNLFTPNVYTDYDVDRDIKSYSSKDFVIGEDFIPNSNDWKPKIWLQRVKLPFEKKMCAIGFSENLNFHIFSLTFKIKSK